MKRYRIAHGYRALAAALLGVALAVGSIGARADDLLAQIKARGFIRVGTFSIPPEAWIDTQTGEWKGIDADFTNEIAKSIGVKVQPVLLNHASLVPSLESGRVDVIAALYLTPERQKITSYNTEPFWYGMDVLITQKTNTGVKKFPDMKGKVLGVTRASAQEIEATALQKKFAVGEIKKYDSADPMLMDLKAGRLDAALWWGTSFDYAIKQNSDYDFKVVEYVPPEYVGSDTLPGNYYVFPKEGSENLIKLFDAQIVSMRKDGRGEKVLSNYGLTNPGYLTGKH
jgi:polar amino acid transport system substrate-binding protein